MSKIINGKKQIKRYAVVDRDLIADKRLSADAKNIYIVLNSLSETCNSVCPSHSWLAGEIGYDMVNKDGTEKDCRLINKFVASKLSELVDLKMVRIVINLGYSSDYEILDYYPVIKSSLPPSKKVQGTPSKKVPLERREEKTDIDTNINISINPKENSNLKQKFNLEIELKKPEYSNLTQEIKDKFQVWWSRKPGKRTQEAFTLAINQLLQANLNGQNWLLDKGIESEITGKGWQSLKLEWYTDYLVNQTKPANRPFAKYQTQAQKEIQNTNQISEYANF